MTGLPVDFTSYSRLLMTYRSARFEQMRDSKSGHILSKSFEGEEGVEPLRVTAPGVQSRCVTTDTSSPSLGKVSQVLRKTLQLPGSGPFEFRMPS